MIRRRSVRGAERTCPQTGLRLIRSAGRTVWRIAKPSYGPLNPPVRPSDITATQGWGRWDTPTGRTIYVGDSRLTTYSETLALFGPSVGVKNTKLADVFVEDEDCASDPRTVLEAISRDWEELWKIHPKRVVAGWRDARLAYELSLPSEGWFVDIEHSDTIKAINREMALEIHAAGIDRITLSHVSGEVRTLTCRIAKWVRGLELFDGSQAHGISYPSKHGADERCWAIWLRIRDDGLESSDEPTKEIAAHTIYSPDQDAELKAAQERFGLLLN